MQQLFGIIIYIYINLYDIFFVSPVNHTKDFSTRNMLKKLNATDSGKNNRVYINL